LLTRIVSQLIELWETYLLQLDSDEDGPPLMPAGIYAEQPAKSDAQIRREEAKAQLDTENSAAAQRRDEEGAPSLSGTTAIEGEGSVRASEDTAHNEGEAPT
jgi:sorting nexin-1/2